MSTTPVPLPGNPPSTSQQQDLQSLWSAIVSGVTEVRFQDRTVRYASIKDMITAYNFASQAAAPGSAGACGAAGASGSGGVRQIRFYTGKGL